ncbi:MAG TPA: histidinol-phosphate transaminase [Blastocatellia bacterium]|nr:histidinol-phosphate transaminase [Blastocatellia bacterium]
MPLAMTRRQWLLSTGTAAAGLTLRPFLRDGVVKGSSPTVSGDGVVRAKLDNNENPYGPSERARRAIVEALNEGCRYPGPQWKELEEMIAKKEGVSPDHVLLGSGSSEILRMAAMAYGPQGGELLTAYPTYEGLENAARTVGGYVHRVPLDKNMAHDLDEMDRRTTQAVRLVFVCNPNNPTGTIIPADRLRAFCREVSRRTVVFVDEAYYEYVEAPEYGSMIDLVREGHNVIVSRTFSKIHGLAGLRIGYAFARPDIVARLRQFRTTYSINVLGVRAALASYQDVEFQAFSRRKNAEGREALYRLLETLGYRYVPSHTNFVFFHLKHELQPFRELMQKQGILVARLFPPYTDWCRVSIGTPEEMRAFAEALRDFTLQQKAAARK